MRSFNTAVLLFFLVSSGLAQVQQPEFLSGLNFLQTSSTDALALLGKAHKTTSSEIEQKAELSGPTVKKVKATVQQYKNFRGWGRVNLTFYEDKLVTIDYWPKNKTMPASMLPPSMHFDFVSVEGFSSKVPLSAFEGQKDPTVPKVYGPRYFMVTVQPTEFVLALVNNGSMKAIFKEGFNLPTVQMYPGYIENIKVGNRSLTGK